MEKLDSNFFATDQEGEEAKLTFLKEPIDLCFQGNKQKADFWYISHEIVKAKNMQSTN